MSDDASEHLLNRTIEIRFVPDESGEVSDREFDVDDLTPESDWRQRVELLEQEIDQELQELEDEMDAPQDAQQGEGGAPDQDRPDAPPLPADQGQEQLRAQDAPVQQVEELAKKEPKKAVVSSRMPRRASIPSSGSPSSMFATLMGRPTLGTRPKTGTSKISSLPTFTSWSASTGGWRSTT